MESSMFKTRLLSGIVLLIIAFFSFYMGAPVLTIVLLLVSLAGYRELTKAFNGLKQDGGFTAPEIVGCIGTAAYYGILLFVELALPENSAVPGLFACVIFLLLAELFVYVFTFPKYQAQEVVTAVFSFLYAPVMLSFIELTRMGEKGIYMVWLILISSWGCDTCAYVVGKLVGKKKIFPVLSPKKSLEGCIGGVVGSALIGMLYVYLVFNFSDASFYDMIASADGGEATLTPFSMAGTALICAAGAVMSMVGDLAASAIKRNKGIKDYGKLIPGHGGIMDRFDSVIVTAPMVYFLSRFLLLAGMN